MAASETFNVYYVLMVDFNPINVLATYRKMGFLNLVNILSSAYDERWRNYDVYDVIVTPQTGNGG